MLSKGQETIAVAIVYLGFQTLMAWRLIEAIAFVRADDEARMDLAGLPPRWWLITILVAIWLGIAVFGWGEIMRLYRRYLQPRILKQC